MCGDAMCAESAVMLSHFSITKNESLPSRAWKSGPSGTSTTAPYSMQPASASTAETFSLKSRRTAARWPGLVGMAATTWIMKSGSWVKWIVPARFQPCPARYGVSHHRTRVLRWGIEPCGDCGGDVPIKGPIQILPDIANVRRCQHIIEVPEGVIGRQWFAIEYIKRRPRNSTRLQRFDKRRFVHYRTARCIDQPRRRSHERDFSGAHQASC